MLHHNLPHRHKNRQTNWKRLAFFSRPYSHILRISRNTARTMFYSWGVVGWVGSRFLMLIIFPVYSFRIGCIRQFDNCWPTTDLGHDQNDDIWYPPSGGPKISQQSRVHTIHTMSHTKLCSHSKRDTSYILNTPYTLCTLTIFKSKALHFQDKTLFTKRPSVNTTRRDDDDDITQNNTDCCQSITTA